MCRGGHHLLGRPAGRPHARRGLTAADRGTVELGHWGYPGLDRWDVAGPTDPGSSDRSETGT